MIHHYLIHECGYRPDEVAAFLKNWELRPFPATGEKMGEIILRGCEIHFALSKNWRNRFIPRKTIRDYFSALLKEKKFLVTRHRKGDVKNEEFDRRLGFVKTREDDKFSYWWLNEAPYERKQKC